MRHFGFKQANSISNEMFGSAKHFMYTVLLLWSFARLLIVLGYLSVFISIRLFAVNVWNTMTSVMSISDVYGL